MRYVQSNDEAFAYVNDRNTPGFDAARTKNFTAISSPASGAYCLTPALGIDLTDRVVLTSPEYQSSAGNTGDVFWLDPTNNDSCAAGELEIQTYVNNVASSNVAFSVFLPTA